MKKHSFIHYVYIKLNYTNFHKLINRLTIFDLYCIPSLLNQTNLNFKVLINVNMADEFFNLVKKYTKYNNFILLDKNINNYLATTKKRKKHILITTRLDSDDVLNIHYIDTIQKYIINIKNNYRLYQQFCKFKTFIINFSMGLQLNTSNLLIRQRFYKIPNPFLTIVSLVNANCIDFQHHLIHHYYYFINIKNKIPMWIQTIHSKNILNSFIHGKLLGKYNDNLNLYFKIKI